MPGLKTEKGFELLRQGLLLETVDSIAPSMWEQEGQQRASICIGAIDDVSVFYKPSRYRSLNSALCSSGRNRGPVSRDFFDIIQQFADGIERDRHLVLVVCNGEEKNKRQEPRVSMLGGKS